MIEKEIIDQVLSSTDLRDVIADFVALTKQGASWYGKCPMCDVEGKGKGLIITPSKGIYKCFSCGFAGKSPIQFLMDTKKMEFPEAVKYLADKYNIIIPDSPAPQTPKRKSGKKELSYRDRQLKDSGLVDADQKATVIIDQDTSQVVDVFQSGTLDQYNRIIDGDDMIIWYFDLQGKHVTYQKPKSNKFDNLYRVRWQNPELHPDKDGRPVKYKSPYGSESHLYIPEIIRRAYQNGTQFKRLYIQEGEKKSEKASKHGLFSVGIMGIHNMGSHNRLPHEFQLIVQKCGVQEVIFVLDSDWDHLNTELMVNKPAEMRTRSFFHAVRTFREYFVAFRNINVYLEVYFAHIKNKKEKGIDDLLAGSLTGKEKKLADDFNFALQEKTGQGEFVDTYKITTMTDGKLLEMWKLHSVHEFAEKYKEELQVIPEFTFGKHRWKFNEDGKIEPAQPLQEHEMFWETIKWEDAKGNEHVKYQFDYENAYNFLFARGFGRYMKVSGDYCFINVINHVVTVVEPYQIKDFVMSLARDICPKDIRNMLYRGGKMYFGPDSLSNLFFLHPRFELSDKNFQNLFFKDKFVKVTAETIEELPLGDMSAFVWKDKIKDFNFSLIKKPFFEIDKVDDTYIRKAQNAGNDVSHLEDLKGNYSINFSDAAQKCHFCTFLFNTGEFYWRKFIDFEFDERTATYKREPKEDTRTSEEICETNLHFLSKITAIGYLLHKYRDKSYEKAVIAMDGRNSEVGDAFGRTGKSILGFAIGKMLPQVYIGGKYKDFTEDRFLFEEVDEKTDNIFFDDVRTSFDFEFFFPIITGRMAVNIKGVRRFTLPEAETPKIFITTNFAIPGGDPSFKDRQMLIAFSDFYNEYHKPIHDFGQAFFDEWDHEQWNLFYNFMVYCVQAYLKFGLISAPTERLESRRLRQFMGEEFLGWADAYFGLSDDISAELSESPRINDRIPRTELYNDFIEKNPNQRKFVAAHRFKKKILAYCKYRDLRLNPHCVTLDGNMGADDKSNGVEYFTIANNRFQT